MTAIFFGTSKYCLPVLETLYKNFDLKLLVTRPDKPTGRKKVLTPSATKKWAIEHKIDSLTPETLKKDTQDRINVMKMIEEIKPDIAIVADFGLIIPEAIFDLPRLKAFNIHFSCLPDLRGPSPVQFTLLRGDQEAWITIFQIEAKMDTGPILWQQKFSIDPMDTTQTLYTNLFQQVSKQLPEIIESYVSKPKTLATQDHSKATICRFFEKDDGFIPWDVLQKALNAGEIRFEDLPKIQQEALNTKNSKFEILSSKSLYDFYRAVTPWPTMWTLNDGKRMIVRKCHLDRTKLILDEIQFEGKDPQKL